MILKSSTSPATPRWVLHAKRGRQIVALHPYYFPLTYSSRDELVYRTILLLHDKDSALARKFAGWQLIPVDASGAITIPEEFGHRQPQDSPAEILVGPEPVTIGAL